MNHVRKLLLFIILLGAQAAFGAGIVSWTDGVSAVDINNLPPITTAGTDPTFVGDVCGTAPAVVGSDMAGKITVGTTATTSCAMTFSTAYLNAPACVVTGDINATLYSAVSTTTIMTITSSADMDSDVVMFHCIGL